MRSIIPNALTLGNLFCGILAIVALLVWDEPVTATYLVAAGLLLDTFDGAVARLLKVSGELGKQLDSLADLVTFGLAPGMMGFWLVDFWWKQHEVYGHWSTYIPLIIPLASALRLAKFNIDDKQTYFFLGLPTPSAAAVMVSLPLVMEFQEPDFLSWWVGHPGLIAALSIVLSLFMLTPVPLVSLKAAPGKRLHWIIPVLGISLLLSFYFLNAMAIPVTVCLYLLLSIVFFRPYEVQSRD